jgi:4-hydroxy-tetrahydrodipicolinate synthase
MVSQYVWEGNMPALVTPFREDDAIDEGAFRRNIETFLDEGVTGLVATGHNGEEWAISPAEKLDLWRWTVEMRDASGKHIPVVGGIDAVLTKDLVEEAKHAQDAGLDAVMITPPFYIAAMSEDEIWDRYQAVASALPSLGLVIYNNPRRTGINLEPAFLARLAELPTTVAIKQSYREFPALSETVRLVGDRASVFPGPASFIFPGVMVGCKGFISTGTEFLGRDGAQFYNIIKSGDFERARAIHHKLVRVYALLNKIGTWPAALKAGLDLTGKEGGLPRKPIRPLTAEQRGQVEEVLASIGILAPAGVAD